MAVPLPRIEIPQTRGLLGQVRAGKGPALKLLRDAIAANPSIKRVYLAERATEEDNDKQRRNMMWVKDANSRVRRVDTSFRDLCTYTNPLGVRELPSRQIVAKSKAHQQFHAASSTEPQRFLG